MWKKAILLLVSHLAVGVTGFAAGIYVLPILIAPPAPTDAEVMAIAGEAEFEGQFQRNLAGSDALHWGEGTLSINRSKVSLRGEIAPGPDYKLYLSPEFVETESQFENLKDRMVRVGDVKTFRNFVVELPRSVNPADFNTAVVWCETFGEFITAAKYR